VIARLNAVPGIVFRFVYHTWGVLLSVCAVTLTTPAQVQILLPMLAAWTAPTLFSEQLRHPLWLLGVSYREQVLHNLRCLAWFAAAPVLAAGIVAGTLMGWSVERVGVVALMAGLLAGRAGFRGLIRASEHARFSWANAWVHLLVASVLLTLPRIWPGIPVIWTTVAGALLLLVGGVGLVRRIRRLDERRLVEARCAAEVDAEVDAESYCAEHPTTRRRLWGS
jgi:hypothetical protein